MAVGQRLFIEDIQGSAFDSLLREGFDHCTFADYGPSADVDQYCVFLRDCEFRLANQTVSFLVQRCRYHDIIATRKHFKALIRSVDLVDNRIVFVLWGYVSLQSEDSHTQCADP